MENCSLHGAGRGSRPQPASTPQPPHPPTPQPPPPSADTHPPAGIFFMPYQFQQAEIKLNCLKASVCLTLASAQRRLWFSSLVFSSTFFLFHKPSMKKKDTALKVSITLQSYTAKLLVKWVKIILLLLFFKVFCSWLWRRGCKKKCV